MSIEKERLLNRKEWEKWGPYVAERSWGTVREDYSEDGEAWNYFTHDMAHMKTFRWGEDGIAGICDRYQVLALTMGFWNGQDKILKERLFGLTTWEGNHGEDVKEYYYYLDNLPSHAYMKYLYKYPMAAYPYEELVRENQQRGVTDREYELLDTGIFNNNRYFDIYIEYAKVSGEDICIKIEAFNRSNEEAPLHIIPQMMFRNAWGWGHHRGPEPVIKKGKGCSIVADDSNADPVPLLNITYRLGERYLYGDEGAEILFTNNESNNAKLYGSENPSSYTKDAFHRKIIHQEEATNPNLIGTKCALHYNLLIPAGGSKKVLLRFTHQSMENPLEDVEKTIAERKKEADAFYDEIHPKEASSEDRMIQRQALAGMLWNKQIYLYDVNVWLKGDDPSKPPPHPHQNLRNTHWKHLISKRILLMPDKWEYPWFAAWDLAFHAVVVGLIDMEFAKDQVWYLLFDQFQHPNGQVPAYEWEFSELNPPVQAWAAYKLFKMEYEKTGVRDISFLKKCFHKLILNFVWWVNKVDSVGNNVFEGGFLGLDNITVIDRSKKVPGGGVIEQSDGTGWMGLFSLVLMRMALELSKEDKDYESMALKFYEHFLYISHALKNSENRDVQLWSETDGFFYDLISFPDGSHQRIAVRSLVGLIPLFAIDMISHEELAQCKEFAQNFKWFNANREDLAGGCVSETPSGDYLLSLLSKCQIERVLTHVWDVTEFRSQYGLRSLSKRHSHSPYELLNHQISYEPGEGETRLKGGNSNWRGPIWFPISFLFIDALKKLHEILGDEFKVSGENMHAMAGTFASGMIDLFRRNTEGNRPIFGDNETLQKDPYWKDNLLFYEHFHGDTGRGLGSSHQTGWSGLVANLIDDWLK
ncbi:MAG: glucosidase [Simkaniaceae bacterium]|nr:glucosidase [Simkaniaceae bacterium]